MWSGRWRPNDAGCCNMPVIGWEIWTTQKLMQDNGVTNYELVRQ